MPTVEQIISSVLYLFFGPQSALAMFLTIFEIIGLFGIFKKCGTKLGFALIPCYRAYVLAKCAGRETEGRVVFLSAVGATIGGIATIFTEDTASNLNLVAVSVTAALQLIRFIYLVRVYLGLCEVFERKKGWWIPWSFAAFVTAMVWGYSKKYQPVKQVEDFRSDALSTFSNAHLSAMEEGLTVNLESRTVPDFFKRKYLLRDVHMYIKPASMVLLLGGSGAGKTTLINAINGYERAKAEITLNGENVYKNYKKMLYNIGFVPQQDLMRGNDTVLHTLTDAASLRLPLNLTAEDRRNRVEEVMELFGLLPVKNSFVSKLSGGQRKRLSIAMEFLSNPQLFILDEPDSGLDGVMARALMQQLREIADSGKIVIVITHTPDRVIDLFDDLIVLAKDSYRTGRLAFYGSIQEAQEFFGKQSMEEIVRSVNRKEEGGEGLADDYILKYAEVQHG